MGFPAARIGDMHVCPFVFTPPPPAPPIPAVGGPITTGFPTVITLGMPQARISDLCACVPPTPPHPIVKGSPTVIVGGMPAARCHARRHGHGQSAEEDSRHPQNSLDFPEKKSGRGGHGFERERRLLWRHRSIGEEGVATVPPARGLRRGKGTGEVVHDHLPHLSFERVHAVLLAHPVH